MRLRWISLICAGLLTLAAVANAQRPSNAELKKQVADTERAFAATMKARDHAAFTSYLSEEATFFSGNGVVLRGKDAVAKGWKGLYDKPEASFSWEPEEVEVVQSGTLAYSGGPIYDAKGKQVGRFNSIWRLEAPGIWRVVFDRGSDFCDCKK
jgi:ketosteroid isomerase-like protein